ncbi:MAG: integrating conjugative element protein [Porticoccus sp.]|jgi:integrating conjugative element protein (TIGR03755 family)|uniref:integrating conjugative element protein n=1 Tax=Cellvibrionales TaxID=1706369 RepID=UPI000C37E424|nr:integrating conjugative element protein [Haliea sp.]MAD65459.1 integrating conjugative element protein [Haliea sp.]|tara:strand:- start:9690 stop:11030 length:1341 start_codon:yes stop_codon:yes gene_type:complete
MIKHNPIYCLLIALSIAIGPVSYAAQAPTEDGLWYYEIGGAEPVSVPANPAVVSTTLGGSAQLGLGYSCGKFDPVAAVTNTLNDIGSGVDNMMNAMTAAATSAIASLPALILQRANPGLYDLFQNALIKAEETMQLATKSCEQMETEIAQGKNPYADLITLSKGNDWKVQMGIGGNDAVTAKDTVESSNGDNGVPWIGGQAGGTGQPVLEFTGDIVEAGYNINMNRAVTDTTPVPAASATRLSEIWGSPAEARDWTVDVVGENIVTTCDTCRKDSIPGTGLLPKLYQESATVTTEIQNLVSGATPLTLTNLEQITAPGVAITRQVIEAIREMPASEQSLIMGRLVSEISTARTVEKALYARRLLLSGRQVPEVYATEVAREHADNSIAELDKEIENLLFETRVRKEVVSDTVATLLERAAAKRQSSLTVPEVPTLDPNPLRGGRVQ